MISRFLTLRLAPVVLTIAFALSGCGGAEPAGDAVGWDALVSLRADVRNNSVDFAVLNNLSNLVGEIEYDACMQAEGVPGYELPAIPIPDPDIDEYLVQISGAEQELAMTMLGPVNNIEVYGLGQAYRSYANGPATLWTREWIRESTTLNDPLYDAPETREADGRCALTSVASEGWLYTETMDTLNHEFSSVIDELTFELDLTDCGPEWVFGDRDFDPFNYREVEVGFPTSDTAAGTAWLDEFEREIALAQEHLTCRADKLSSGDDKISDLVDDFRDDHSELIAQAAADWDETHQILQDLVNGAADIDDERISNRRSWAPDWGVVTDLN